MGDEYPLLITVYACDGGPGDGVSGGALTLMAPGLGELKKSSFLCRLLG